MESAAEIRALLVWYEAMGVDALVADTAPALRTLSPPPKPGTGRSNTPSQGQTPKAADQIRRDPTPGFALGSSMGAAEGIAEATALAQACTSLDQLANAIHGFDGCALKPMAMSTVVADGHPDAPLMIIGEAPGADEDRQGLPFVGRSGQLLDRMLSAIGLNRRAEDPTAAAYITNIIPWRPPGNRQPSPSEMAICLPFAQRHVALKAPKLVLLMGGTAAKAMLGETTGIMRLRGQWRQMQVPGMAGPVKTMATFHPAYLLRQPAQKREVWRDLLMVKAALEGRD